MTNKIRMNTRSKPRSITLGFLLLGLLINGCSPQIPEIPGTAYYVDCKNGQDTNTGISPTRAWGTLEAVNGTVFKPGDGILFKRGTICQGMLAPQGSGTIGRPIVIDTYGRGDLPIIDADDKPEAIKLVGQEYWEIGNLETVGGRYYGVVVKGQEGIDLLHHIRLTNLVVHDVWGGVWGKNTGLVVIISNGSIFEDVIIDGVTAYNTSQWAGIEVNGGRTWPINWNDPKLAKNVVVRNSTVYNVYGDGIVLWGVKNGVIEYSVAYDTGQQPPPQTVGTPSSIWT